MSDKAPMTQPPTRCPARKNNMPHLARCAYGPGHEGAHSYEVS